MPIKFVVLGGGIWVFFLGGGSADFIFMGARIFLIPCFFRGFLVLWLTRAVTNVGGSWRLLQRYFGHVSEHIPAPSSGDSILTWLGVERVAICEGGLRPYSYVTPISGVAPANQTKERAKTKSS